MYYQITEAAKKLNVETHVLRFWEEELELAIKRNEQGHRLYTDQDIERFQFIMDMKKEGLKLKAIHARVHQEESTAKPVKGSAALQEGVIQVKRENHPATGKQNEKAAQLCMMLQQMVGQAVRQENASLVKDVKKEVADVVAKEMNYQFRMQEERDEEHYRRLDELLREKSRGTKRGLFGKKEDKNQKKHPVS